MSFIWIVLLWVCDETAGNALIVEFAKTISMEALVSDCASAIQRLGLISCDSTILQLGAQFGLGVETFEGIAGVDQLLSTHCPISCQICDGNITMLNFNSTHG